MREQNACMENTGVENVGVSPMDSQPENKLRWCQIDPNLLSNLRKSYYSPIYCRSHVICIILILVRLI